MDYYDPAALTVPTPITIRALAAAVRDGTGGDPSRFAGELEIRLEDLDDTRAMWVPDVGDFQRAVVASNATPDERRWWQAVALGHYVLRHHSALHRGPVYAVMMYRSTAEVAILPDAHAEGVRHAAEALLFAETYVGDELASAARDAIAALGGPQ
jgi:hypothetical protein